MNSSNWLKFLAALAVGVAAGLVYGWLISPVEYTDAPPSILRADYRADYALMTAEAYQKERDADAAARRLALLGSEPPAQIAAAALQYATANGFTQSEILALQGLLNAMQTYQPQENLLP
ncbi:MAG: hypothetical protein LDL51_02625 [Chloroflexi bacterium]|nr:hypothetical protein [Chloroflexota bacterium]